MSLYISQFLSLQFNNIQKKMQIIPAPNTKLVSVAKFMLTAVPAQELEDPLRPSHAALNVQCANVLPVLLQQGHKEVDAEVNIGH